MTGPADSGTRSAPAGPHARGWDDPADVMRRAVELARQAEGRVEPNPLVGAVIVDDRRQLIAEGWHDRFGGPHAEVMALNQAGPRAAGQTLFVTLEPCCHFGKTPPCTQAILNSGLRRVIVGLQDPNPRVSGQGLQLLRDAGLEVEVGLLAEEVRRLNAPFLKRMLRGLPFVHAKWAMTLDGKLATKTGHSRWISNERSRAVVHELRGRMDAIVVGAGTVRHDDPLLTARPPGPRTPLRVVISTTGHLPVTSQLVRTAAEVPVLMCVERGADEPACRELARLGVEVWQPGAGRDAGAGTNVSENFLLAVLRELSRRDCTNVLVEGGERLLGAIHDAGLIDEVHVFLAPKLAGGKQAYTPVGGVGLSHISEQSQLADLTIRELDGDIYVRGRVTAS